MSLASSSDLPKTGRTCLLLTGSGIVAPCILEDMAQALARQGWQVHFLPLSFEKTKVAQTLRVHKVELVISLDGKGLNQDLFPPHLCRRATWFVDNPFYFPEELGQLCSEDAIFVWDEAYILELRAQGFKNVIHLPLATNAHRFKPQVLSTEDIVKYGADVSFVGTVGAPARQLRHEREQQYPLEINRLVDQFLVMERFLRDPQKGDCAREGSAQARCVIAKEFLPVVLQLVDRELDAIWRYELVEALSVFDARIYGPQLMCQFENAGSRLRYQGEVDYRTELCKVYQASRINTNATRPQLQTTVNQRVLDVFASGGFLLTDYRPFLKEVIPFPVDEITYQTPAELQKKVAHFLHADEQRTSLSIQARAAILQSHTYDHRMREMLARLKL